MRLRRLYVDASPKTWHVPAIAFSEDGRLGVASACAYVLALHGALTSAKYGEDCMRNVSYCCGKFGFVNWGMDNVIECEASIHDVKDKEVEERVLQRL